MVPMTPDQILANARALAPEIAARATEAVRLRRLPRDIVEKLRAAGCFRVMFPKSWGGPEMPLPTQLELVELLAHADAAAAWCVKIGSDSGLFAAWLEESAARELYTDIDFVTAGQAPPNGRARERLANRGHVVRARPRGQRQSSLFHEGSLRARGACARPQRAVAARRAALSLAAHGVGVDPDGGRTARRGAAGAR